MENYVGTKTFLEMTIEDGQLIVTPVNEERDEWTEALKKTSEKYGGTL